MKNLMTFANPAKRFVDQYSLFVRMQIDNTLEMGWSPEDIMLVTNFPYEYRGVEAIVLDDATYCEHRKRASKINMICELIKQGILKDVAWFHDFDAFQAEPLGDILGEYDAAFTDYGTNGMWNTGSFFFKPSALDIFERIQAVMNRRKTNEEVALKRITDAGEFSGRYIKLNGTYNHGRMRETEKTYAAAEKPIKVFHFDPHMNDLYRNVKPFLPSHLNSLFENYGFLC
jgi:hypothetical protein